MTLRTNGSAIARLFLPILAILFLLGFSANIVFAASVSDAGKTQLNSYSPVPASRGTIHHAPTTNYVALAAPALQERDAQPSTAALCVQAGGGATGAPCGNPTAIPNIQTAVNMAAPGDEILVANGSYTGSGAAVVVINNNITIRGGYPGGTTGWGASTSSTGTLVDGQGARPGFQIAGGVTAGLENLTVNNGGISNAGTVSVGTAMVLNLQNNGSTNGAFTGVGMVAFPTGAQSLSAGTSFSNARVSGGVVTLSAGTVTVQNFDLTAGTLTDNNPSGSTLNITGSFDWDGGVMSGTEPSVSVTNVNAGATFNLGGVSQNKSLNNRKLNNNGNAFMNGTGTGNLIMNQSAEFYNGTGPGSSATFTIQNNDSIQYSNGATPRFYNYGVLRKLGTTGTTILGNGFIELYNNGAIRVETGIITLNSNSTDTGIYYAASNTTLRFGGGIHTLGPASHVEIEGTIEFQAGTTYIDGFFSVTGTTLFTGGIVFFTSPPTINVLNVGPNSILNLEGETLNVNTLNWTGGVIDGGTSLNMGRINILVNGIIGGVTSNKVLVNAEIYSSGNVVLNTTGTGALIMNDGSRWHNLSGAIFDFVSNDSVLYNSGVYVSFINNAGATVRKSGGGTAGTSIFTSGFFEFNNAGTMSVLTGTISVQGTGQSGLAGTHTGVFNMSTQSTLRFAGGAEVMQPSTSITGQGNFEVSAGTVTVGGLYNVGGQTRVNVSGNLQFNSDQGAVSNYTNLAANGIIGGQGVFTNTGIFDWVGGTMLSDPGSPITGTTIIPPNATLNIGGVNAAKALTNRRLNNLGSAYVNGTGTGVLMVNDNAVFSNGSTTNSTALFDIRNNDSIVYNNGTRSYFRNYGTVRKTLGASLSTLGSGQLSFNNYNLVDVLTGTLSLDGGTSNDPQGSTGRFQVATQSNLRFNGGNHTLEATTQVTGLGTAEFRLGTVNIGGVYDVANTNVTGGTVEFNNRGTSALVNLSSGTLSGFGTGVFTATNTFNWTGGTMAGTGTTIIAPLATLNIGGVSATKVLTSRTLRNFGQAFVNGTGTGALNINNGATFVNEIGALFDIRNNDPIQYSSGTASLFRNSGMLKKTIGAATTILGSNQLSFNNDGSVEVLTGTLSLNGGGVSTGSFTMDTVAVLQFGGGNHTLQPGSSVTGEGNLNFSLGNVNIGGSYNITGITNIGGGTAAAIFNTGATSTVTNLMPNGTLSGSGIFTTTDTLNWTGGVMDGVGGITSIPAVATLNIGGVGAVKTMSQRTLNNRGTAFMNGTGAGALTITSGATFNNQVGAFFNIQNNDSVQFNSGANAYFNNHGTFRKAAGSGTSNVATGSLYFINNGIVEVLTGVINLGANYSQPAGTLILNGGDVRSAAPSLTFAGGSIVGTGAITTTVNNTGTTIDPSFNTPGAETGQITIYGNYTQGNAGTLSVDVMGFQPVLEFDKLQVNGTTTLSGTLDIARAPGFEPPLNSTFGIISRTSGTGNFTALTGWYIGNGLGFRVITNTTTVSLQVYTGFPTPTPTVTGTPPTRTPTVVVTPSGTPGTGTPTATPCAMNFSDVDPNNPFYINIRYLYCAGVISGYSDGTFRPQNETTRGQLTKIVSLAEGWPLLNPPDPRFIDVPTTHTFYQYIETAADRGVISGYADGTFRPFNNVTRGQLSKIVVEAEQWTLICPPNPNFSDVPNTHPFYCYIETAFSRGIISGYADGTFRPFNNATRGQICKIVYNAITQP